MSRLWPALLLSLFLPTPGAQMVLADGALRFEERLIMDGFTYSFGVATADLDGDGDLDITAADALPNDHLYCSRTPARGDSGNITFSRTIRSVWSDTQLAISTMMDTLTS